MTNRITLNESTTQMSNLFFNLGVQRIEMTKLDGDILSVNVETSKTFRFDKKSISLSDFSISVGENLLTLNQDNNFKIGILGERAYIETPDYRGFYDESDLKTRKSIEVFALISFLNELLYSKEKLDTSSAILSQTPTSSVESCSFLDQVFSVGVGITSTSAQADLAASIEEDMKSGAVSGCTRIGEPEAVPFTGGTVWVQVWCCP